MASGSGSGFLAAADAGAAIGVRRSVLVGKVEEAEEVVDVMAGKSDEEGSGMLYGFWGGPPKKEGENVREGKMEEEGVVGEGE